MKAEVFPHLKKKKKKGGGGKGKNEKGDASKRRGTGCLLARKGNSRGRNFWEKGLPC